VKIGKKFEAQLKRRVLGKTQIGGGVKATNSLYWTLLHADKDKDPSSTPCQYETFSSPKRIAHLRAAEIVHSHTPKPVRQRTKGRC